MTDRIERLPKWARQLIVGLERRIDEPDALSLAPGSVNQIQLTRREIAMARLVADGETAREVRRLQR